MVTVPASHLLELKRVRRGVEGDRHLDGAGGGDVASL